MLLKNRGEAMVAALCMAGLLLATPAGAAAISEEGPSASLFFPDSVPDGGEPHDIVPMPEFARRHIVLGLEYGACNFRPDEFDDHVKTGTYFGMRYSREFNLNTAFSASFGYLRAETNIVDGSEVEFFPVRAQYEIGSYLGYTHSRWYVGGGGGYNLSDDLPTDEMVDKWPVELPEISSEWITHAVFGLEFRNLTLFSARLETGHVWLLDSGADMWVSSLTVAYQF